MSQDLIWDHFQNEGVESFRDANARLEFLVRQLKHSERVLNIGVGSGALEQLAARKGVEIYALDPSERAIVTLRGKLGCGSRAQVGYSQNIPFPDGSFDVVVMTEVIEHLGNEVRHKSLREAQRVLKLGGRFIGTVPARESLQASAVVCPECGHHFHRWGHQASFDVTSLADTLRRYFYVEVVEERFFNEWESATWKRRALGLLKKFLSSRGLGTYGAARNIYFSVHKVAQQAVDD